MARVKTNPILLISPLDPTGQSGLVRDALVLNQLGKTSITICTAIANQNDVEIDDLTTLSFEEIKRQLDAIGRRYWLDWAIVTGVHDLNLTASIIRYLEQSRPGIRILWNPALQHTGRAYKEQLNRQEQALFETLCKKVHTVFLDQRDLLLFSSPLSSKELIISLSQVCNIYLAGEALLPDQLYIEGNGIEQSLHSHPIDHVTFLSTLSTFLYDGIEIREACSKSLLFLSNKSIN